MNEIKCKNCDSTKIIKDAKITDFGHANIKNNLSIHIKETDSIFFNKSVKSEILAQICGNCGKIELKINNPKELWNAYIK
ncbi:hypothetical protein [Winogradskyella helgolandensis]|uniref:hypothetical protein n=1 Tax=Winogradskyella helgolandensis TaxID=2697010 RepID=UPI0015C9F9E9|nr:hypothetical protein [Winogradskyella helgolandensis]